MTLIALCAAALIGILFGLLTHPPAASLLALSALALPATFLASASRRWQTVAALACALALGAARASLGDALPGADSLSGLLQHAVAALAPIRQAAQSGIAAYLPEPQASLASGVLLGGSGHLDAAFKDDLQRSGLGHLVAIDGFKEVVVAVAIGGVATRLVGPFRALVPCLLAIAAYTLLSGAHASAVRAALMLTLAGLARVCGRIADPLTSLGLAVLLMALVEPTVLLDLGLQLSLSATLGIVLLWPMLRRRLRLYRLPRALAEPIGLSLAVTLGCLPLTLSVFQTVSLVSPLAHVLAVPVLPGVLVSTALLALAASVPPLGSAVAWLAWVPTSALVMIIQTFGRLPGAAVATGRLSPEAASVLALGLLGWGVWNLPELREARLAWASWRAQRREVVLPLTCTGACVVLGATLTVLRPDGRLHVERLPVERGEAVFVRGPTGVTALVVRGSPRSTVLKSRVAEHLNIWEHRLDTVVAMDQPAARALGPTLARYPPRHLIAAAADSSAAAPMLLAVGGSSGGGSSETLEVGVSAGRLEVQSRGGARSARTTSAARPGSAD